MASACRLPAQEPGANLQVYLMTMGAGADIDERFGHNAFWIRDTVAHTDIVYNFGTFSMGDGPLGLFMFGVRFALGPQRYWLDASDLQRTLNMYRRHQRDLRGQELNFTPAQRADIAARLAINAREENRYYRYDYFLDNCSTRVRDLLDIELGGALKVATLGKPAEGTYRWHTRRSITNNVALFISIDAAFGHNADRPLDQWGEMFLPAKVQQRVHELTVAGPDGQPEPLVKHEIPLLTIGAYAVEKQPPPWTLMFLVVGLAITGLIRLARSPRPIALVGRLVAGAWLLLMGIGGLILIFFWVATKHWAMYANFNLLLLSPLGLLLVGVFWRRGGSPLPPRTPRVAMFMMVSVIFGAAMALLPGITGQDNKLIAALVALPTFSVALEALAIWNRQAAVPGLAPSPEA